eukprot:TRINITY_DN3045_c0_g1_i1.p1 TRINITY_DN3045_c0_g1~~TRINITY_DN3045_c0_g1_i1.p1  ORF type:complete len:163 (+),score=19.94 TRINITY_DN3045_c0_g1_i1:577-1065(+)
MKSKRAPKKAPKTSGKRKDKPRNVQKGTETATMAYRCVPVAELLNLKEMSRELEQRVKTVVEKGYSVRRHLTKGDIKRLCLKAKIKRNASSTYDKSRTIIQKFLSKLLATTAIFMELTGERKTVCPEDINFALQERTHPLHRSVDNILPHLLGQTSLLKDDT